MAFDNSQEIPTDAEVRAAVIAGLRAHQHTKFSGYHGLEFMQAELALSKVTVGTIFATIADLVQQAGRPGDYSTIGGVVQQGLGVIELGEAHNLAHEIGCNCAPEPLTGGRAADVIEGLDNSVL